jgi:hypothetical protein
MSGKRSLSGVTDGRCRSINCLEPTNPRNGAARRTARPKPNPILRWACAAPRRTVAARPSGRRLRSPSTLTATFSLPVAHSPIGLAVTASCTIESGSVTLSGRSCDITFDSALIAQTALNADGGQITAKGIRITFATGNGPGAVAQKAGVITFGIDPVFRRSVINEGIKRGSNAAPLVNGCQARSSRPISSSQLATRKTTSAPRQLLAARSL